MNRFVLVGDGQRVKHLLVSQVIETLSEEGLEGGSRPWDTSASLSRTFQRAESGRAHPPMPVQKKPHASNQHVGVLSTDVSFFLSMFETPEWRSDTNPSDLPFNPNPLPSRPTSDLARSKGGNDTAEDPILPKYRPRRGANPLRLRF